MDTVKRLQELLDEKNMKISTLAKLAGLGRTTLQTTISRGGQLSVDTIERICEVFNITLAEFFTEKNATIPDNIASNKELSPDEIKILREMIQEHIKNSAQ